MPGSPIVTAFAEHASGAGWGNSPIWVVVRGPGGRLALECIQPNEQTVAMRVLYSVSAAAHSAMTAAVTGGWTDESGQVKVPVSRFEDTHEEVTPDGAEKEVGDVGDRS